MNHMGNPKLSSKVKMRKDLAGYILYRTNGTTLLLNSVGYDILSLCDGRNSPTDMVAKIKEKYNVETEIKDDIIKFLEDFKGMELVDY